APRAAGRRRRGGGRGGWTGGGARWAGLRARRRGARAARHAGPRGAGGRGGWRRCARRRAAARRAGAGGLLVGVVVGGDEPDAVLANEAVDVAVARRRSSHRRTAWSTSRTRPPWRRRR